MPASVETSPVVAGQGGNAGAQTATIAVRSIALATLLGVIIPLGLKWAASTPPSPPTFS